MSAGWDRRRSFGAFGMGFGSPGCVKKQIRWLA